MWNDWCLHTSCIGNGVFDKLFFYWHIWYLSVLLSPLALLFLPFPMSFGSFWTKTTTSIVAMPGCIRERIGRKASSWGVLSLYNLSRSLMSSYVSSGRAIDEMSSRRREASFFLDNHSLCFFSDGNVYLFLGLDSGWLKRRRTTSYNRTMAATTAWCYRGKFSLSCLIIFRWSLIYLQSDNF